MQPDKYYYDPFLKQNICVAFENTGYCADLCTCKYLHRKNNLKDASLEELLQMGDDDMGGLPLFGSKPVYSPKQKKSNASVLIGAKYRQPEVIKIPPKIEQKVDLMPSLRKRVVSKPVMAKNAKCHQCRVSLAQDSLFCNSFCGHLMCYDCIQRDKTCKQCSVPVDIDTAHIFFKTYCKGCQSQNLVKDNSKLCVQCKFQQQLREEKARKHAETLQKMTDHHMQCIICMNGKKEHAVFPCAHMLYCQICVKLVMNSKTCFFCNSSVSGSCKIYY